MKKTEAKTNGLNNRHGRAGMSKVGGAAAYVGQRRRSCEEVMPALGYKTSFHPSPLLNDELCKDSGVAKRNREFKANKQIDSDRVTRFAASPARHLCR